MKVLSLKQPFAELVVSGKKTIELRKWNTNFRGKFLVHASLRPDSDAMEKFGFNSLPLGCIVGEVELTEVKKYFSDGEFDLDKYLHLADNSYGKYGFVLRNAKRIKEIKCKGKLGFWNLEMKGGLEKDLNM